MADLHWDDLRMFQALVRAGTVRRAARALDVHASTVTRRLERFEQELGARLFHRSPGGLTITDAGRDTLRRVEAIDGQIADLRRSVAGADDRLAGRIVVSLPHVVAGVALPAIATLSGAHPGIDVEFVPASAEPDITRGEADCALTITDDPPQHLIGRRVGELALAVYATREIAAASDYSSAGWVESAELPFDFRLDAFPDVPVRHRCGDIFMQYDALRQGLGLGPLPCVLGDSDPGLVRIEPPRPAIVRDIWLLAHPDLRSTARIREFMRVVGDAFGEAQALLAGRAAKGIDRVEADL